ncbi:MAG: molybdopterin-dependent oxidoreductase [Nocardioides sp.]
MHLPSEDDFTSRLRSPAVAARVGVWLGICFAIAFVTGLISHYAQVPSQPIPFPTSPSWGYRVTQGLHELTGTAAIPLLLVKLWTVYPKLLSRPPKQVRELVLHGAERVSIAVLVGAAIFQLSSGLANSAQWYPWGFSFRPTHYAMAWVTIGSLAVHIAVKLPIIRRALGADVDDTGQDHPARTAPAGPLTRRGLLRTTWAASAVAVLASAGSSVPVLRKVSAFGVRSGGCPQDVPINRSAYSAKVTGLAMRSDYTLTVAYGDRQRQFSRAQLLAMPQTTADLPIACVEGWSAGATWTGVRMRDLLDRVAAPRGKDVIVESLQPSGGYRITTLQANFADHDNTLVALVLNGAPLDLEHGFPCRLIAPDRPGVLQTKWLKRLDVQA